LELTGPVVLRRLKTSSQLAKCLQSLAEDK